MPIPVIWNVPVASEHVGCVTVPAVGAAGVAGLRIYNNICQSQ
jgi:hypothetical protein